MFRRLSAAIARHPVVFDVTVALIWLGLSLADSEVWEDDTASALVPAAIIMSTALLWRRRYPLHVFGFQALLLIVLTALDVDDPVPAAMVCGTYSLGAHLAERRFGLAAFVSMIVIGFATVLITSPDYIPDTLFIVLVLTIAWVIGDSLRTRRAYQQSLVDRAERAEALQASLAQQAVAQERTRIARDMHDVVAHSMSLMVVQAGAARRVAESDPQASMKALEAIESVGRNSLEEMRRILGVLRGDENPLATTPQPDIAAIEPLVDEFVAAGLTVELTHTGHRRPLSPNLELTAYRIVQESLTNVLKHAGRASTAVTLHFDDQALQVTVENARGPFQSNSAADSTGGRKGHVGMHERVAAFGGELTLQPRLDGGYRVTAVLPLAASALMSRGTS